MREGAGWPGAALVASVLLACGNGGAAGMVDTDGDTDGPQTCKADEHAPITPTLVSPTEGPLFPGNLALQSTAFVDADGDVHDASQWEIRLAVDGEPTVLAWSAEVTDPDKLTSVVLSDGTFELGTALADRQAHVARVRHRDASDSCNWSEWSPWVEFTTDESMYLFDPDAIHTFELEIPPESWDLINAEAEPPGCVQFSRSYHPGALVFEGQRFEGVGIRAKGGCGSSRNLGGKAAFKVKLDWDDPDVPGCGPDRELFGLSTLTLNNGVQDETAMHERLAHRWYREHDIPAPRAANARVNVNGEYWGLYIHVESINRAFLKRWFDDHKGMMYEGAYWCDLVESNIPATLDGESCFQREFKHDEVCDGPIGPDEDAKDWELLRDLTRRIEMLPGGEVVPGAAAFLDLDRFITMMAIETLTAHWDGYPWELNNNYRVYHEPIADRWTVLPWGVDQTFERPDFDPWDKATGVLSRACLNQPECQDLFAARLYQMADAFEQAGFLEETMAFRDQIRSHLEEDPRKEFSMPEWETRVDDTLSFIAGRPDFVRDLLATHGY